MDIHAAIYRVPAEWMRDDQFLILWKEYQSHPVPGLWERMVYENLPLIAHVIRIYPVSGMKNLETQDVEAYGVLGLVEALCRFDPDRNDRFTPFAVQSIRREIYNGVLLFLGQSRYFFRKNAQLQQIRAQAEQELQRDPNEGELIKRMGKQWRSARTAQIQTFQPLSVDSEGMEERIPAQEADVETLVSQKDEHLRIELAMKGLDPREARIVRMHYYDRLTYGEIGRILGISSSWACRLAKNGTDKLTRLLRVTVKDREAPVKPREKTEETEET